MHPALYFFSEPTAMSGRVDKWTSGQEFSHDALWAATAHRQAGEDGRAGGVSMSLDFFGTFLVKQKSAEKSHEQ